MLNVHYVNSIEDVKDTLIGCAVNYLYGDEQPHYPMPAIIYAVSYYGDAVMIADISSDCYRVCEYIISD